ncbi:MAG: hypothetical protein ABSA64_11330 [Sedimentisphaerales bacterium]|jgi:hypothetical protein
MKKHRKKKLKNWYSQIEEPVRELVRLLRNNGFNTTCSCGHSKPCPCVEMEWYGFEEEARRVYNLLCENGYNSFEIRLFWPSSGIGRFMEIRLLNER